MSTNSERFWPKVDKTRTCWLWNGSKNSEGYGNFYYNGRSGRAHRWSYEQAKGAIPAGLVIDHLCRVTNCVNPAHLEAVEHRENVVRGISGIKQQYCSKGHELTSDNLRVSYSSKRNNYNRQCKQCKSNYMREWYQKKKLQAKLNKGAK